MLIVLFGDTSEKSIKGSVQKCTIPFVSQERRGLKSSNFTLIFVTLKTCQKIDFPKQAVGSFTNGFSGTKSFRDFRETGPSIHLLHLCFFRKTLQERT